MKTLYSAGDNSPYLLLSEGHATESGLRLILVQPLSPSLVQRPVHVAMEILRDPAVIQDGCQQGRVVQADCVVSCLEDKSGSITEFHNVF